MGAAAWTEVDLALLDSVYQEWPVRLPVPLLARHGRGGCHSMAYRRGLTRRRQVGPQFGHVQPSQWAWFAGFFDGEGTAYVHPVRPSVKASMAAALIHVCNTHLPTMEYVRTVWPGGTWSVRVPQEDERKLPLYTYKWTRRALIREVSAGLLPYVITKREPILTALAALDAAYPNDRFSALT